MTQHKTQQSGFTLIEVLLAVGITSMVMLTVGVTFRVTLEARAVVECDGQHILFRVQPDFGRPRAI